MIQIRKSQERGHIDHGWLNTFHTFSFGDYHDPENMGFRDLRVINEDIVAGGTGFGTHGHRDMEIITYIMDGALEHKDSMGTGSIIKPGDIQRMSAGSGVQHSEFNHSKTNSVHLFQVWILPAAKNTKPSYEQKFFAPEEKKNKLRLIASKDSRDGAIAVHQDVEMYASLLDKDKELAFSMKPGRYGWIQLGKGELKINDVTLHAGDGAAISKEQALKFKAVKDSEFIFFDLN
jgi:redox-sensitive bicupin YhaK (pirin superfamily)